MARARSNGSGPSSNAGSPLAVDGRDYNPSETDQAIIREVQDCITEGKRWHNQFVWRVERRYDAWRGLQPDAVDNAKPQGWRSNQHPPYLINIVEGMLASLEEVNPQWNVVPRALPEMTAQDMAHAADNADFVSALITHQMRIDNFGAKAGMYAHQDLVAGFSPMKIHWLKQTAERPLLTETPELIYDETGGTIDIANKLNESKQDVVLRDDPTMEVRDVRDFMFPESATDIQKAPWVIDRTFVTYETLERMQALGVYQNVEYIKETRYDETHAGSVQPGRELKLRNADRTRGLVEICERWTNDSCSTVANNMVLLRHGANPLFVGRKPFVIASAIPDLFQIPGVSVIEGLAGMQEMLWTLMNMRLDATRIAASVITLIRGDVDNAEDYEFAPEAQWIVPDPNAVKPLDLSAVAQAAASTLQAEGLLRGDIQNVMGGLPFTGSAQSQTQPTNTATGVSIVTNIAQAILARRKTMYQRAFAQAAQMFLELDQKLLREERLVPIFGMAGEKRLMEVFPTDIQAIYDIELELSEDSQLRAERRAEKQSLLTIALQGAPIMAQFGGGVNLNLKAFWEELLDAFGLVNTQKFFAAAPSPQQPAAAPGMGSPPNAQSILDQMAGGAPGGGITNPSLAAGPSAPSSPVSMSGSAAMQRTLSRVGAGRSA